MRDFLPISSTDMKKRGWDCCDFVYVIGDAYVDHSSFGPAIISRVLESHGYRVGIISQPDWKNPSSIDILGRPRLGWLVSSGNMDSMVNHYTVNKKRRSSDAYTPGGVIGKRPDYALSVYCKLIRSKYPDDAILVGGIEASLRRLAHYDYWSDSMKHSALLDSGADILMYGMGELSIVALAEALDSGLMASDCTFIPGTVYKTTSSDAVDMVLEDGGIMLPSWSSITSDKREYAKSFDVQYRNTDFASAKKLVEPYGDVYVVQNPPQRPLTTMEFDDVYELPYMNDFHPSYKKLGGVPAISEIKFSLTSNRGCFGGCSFCALTFHQGRVVQVRSHESLVREATAMTQDPDFKGYIHDVGGPTANFRRAACDKQLKHGACQHKQCLYPAPCKNMKVNHSDYVALLRKLRALPKVKKVFIRSGIRFDYMLADKSDAFLRELCEHHISGQLRVAPEHVSDNVLDLMGKPRNEVYQEFVKKFYAMNKRIGKEQYVVPYLISSHPGSTLTDAIALAESVRDMGYMPEQVQDFYPTPSTISSVMYYTGVDPRTMKHVAVIRNPHDKAVQRALIQYRKPENYELVKEALIKAHRTDLIGFDRTHCLIAPRKIEKKDDGGRKPSGNRGGRDSSRGYESRGGRTQNSRSQKNNGKKNSNGRNSGRRR